MLQSPHQRPCTGPKRILWTLSSRAFPAPKNTFSILDVLPQPSGVNVCSADVQVALADNFGVRAMLCLACGGEMILVNVVQDDTAPVSGFEHHSFKCSECQDEEQRLVFASHTRKGRTEPAKQASLIVPASSARDENVAASGLLGRPVGPAAAPDEPIQTVSVRPAQTAPVEMTVLLKANQTAAQQTVPLQQVRPEPTTVPQSNAWARVLEKLRKRTAAAREIERRAQFKHIWDNLLSDAPRSISSTQTEEPARSATGPVVSEVPTARD